MKLGERLREVRQQRKLTLLQVAQATDLSVSYLSDLERGRTRPSFDTLERLATCFRLSPADIVAGVDGWGSPTIESLAPGLQELVEAGRLPLEDALDLSRIELRGRRPRTSDEWYELYIHLAGVIRRHNPQGEQTTREDE